MFFRYCFVVARAAACAMLAASVVAASDEPSTILEPVIPPGQEALLAGMLGRGIALPDCTLASCGVDHTVVVATYACDDGDVTFELAHPQTATDGSVQTAQFAITVVNGTTPPALGNALVSLVRARENAFVWASQESAADVENDGAAE